MSPNRITCPSCNLSSSTRAVPAIYNAGTRSYSTISYGRGSSGTSRSELANLLAPPSKDWFPIELILVVMLIFAGFFVFATMMGARRFDGDPMAPFNEARAILYATTPAQLFSIEGARVAGALYGALNPVISVVIAIGCLVLILIALLISLFRSAVTAKANEAILDRRYAAWEELFYCSRCAVVYHPRSGLHDSVMHTQQLINQVLEAK